MSGTRFRSLNHPFRIQRLLRINTIVQHIGRHREAFLGLRPLVKLELGLTSPASIALVHKLSFSVVIVHSRYSLKSFQMSSQCTVFCFNIRPNSLPNQMMSRIWWHTLVSARDTTHSSTPRARNGPRTPCTVVWWLFAAFDDVFPRRHSASESQLSHQFGLSVRPACVFRNEIYAPTKHSPVGRLR